MKHGVVAAGHEETARAAQEILRAGGNAYDAILAAVLCACACEPVLSSLGGGGFLLASPAQGQSCVYDFFADTPSKRQGSADIDFYPIDADFGGTLQEFHIGKASIAVPGQLKGVFSIHRDLGSMPIREVFAPAISLCKKGVRINAYQAYLFEVIQATYKADQKCMEIYGSCIKEDHMVQEGEVLKNPELADVLEQLSYEGEGLFYEGEIARLLVADMQDGGGLIAYEDLQQYEVIKRKSLEVEYRNAKILMNPPPAAGGLLVGFGLKLLQEIDVARYEPGSEEYLLLLADILDKTLQGRVEFEAQSEDSKKADLLLDEGFLEKFSRDVMGRLKAHRGTTHISVIDKDKNMAAMTVSNGEGAGYVIPQTGIVMNNMLGEEDLNPGGFHKWEPHERLSSMMCPTCMFLEDGRRIALGSGGSNRIRTAILQLIINLVDFNLSIEDAVRMPRIHLEPERLYIEGGFDNGLEALLSDFPEHDRWQDSNMFFGGTHVACASKSEFLGYGDNRRSGVFFLA